jgi:(Z)-2-((N-methylformamido)methylene)-5-hydroxybutyrolactone dehydrogenase
MAADSAEITTYKMFINGEWVDAASGQCFDSLNPYTGQAWATQHGGVAPQRHAVAGAAPQTKGEAAADRTPGA